MINNKTHLPALTQFSTMNALLVGLYNGFFPVHSVCGYGDFGLGCPDGAEGEMTILNGECYVAPANKPPRKMGENENIAFAQVAHFEPTFDVPVSNIRDKNHLANLLLTYAETTNLFIGFRLTGVFSSMKIRQPPSGLTPPYPPLVDVLKTQTELIFQNLSGTVLGFWTPSQYQGTSVAGIHFHFLSDDKSCSGHVIDTEIESGQLEIQLYHRFNLHLPENKLFLNTELAYDDLDEHIRKAEG